MISAKATGTASTVTRVVDFSRRASKTTFAIVVDQTMGRLLDTDPSQVKFG